jgi:hypothetical protein
VRPLGADIEVSSVTHGVPVCSRGFDPKDSAENDVSRKLHAELSGVPDRIDGCCYIDYGHRSCWVILIERIKIDHRRARERYRRLLLY